MSGTPELIIVTWRKFLHDFFMWGSSLAAIYAVIGFIAGGTFIPLVVIAVVGGLIATKIKFKLVKQIEVGGYKLV